MSWSHPELGRVPPATFVPIAEESAPIGALTDWVLNTACAQLRAFGAADGPLRPPRLHVNVSGSDLCRAGFVPQLAAALRDHGLSPCQLCLEISERTLMHRLDGAPTVMAQLRELGVGLSVDAFGTDHSSLACLSTLPINSLKIGHRFIQRLQGGLEESQDSEVVGAVLMLGQALGKSVIAEGIETPEQLAQLRRLGAEYGQGHLLSRPLTSELAAAAARGDPQPDDNGASTAPAALAVPFTTADAVHSAPSPLALH